MRKIIITFILLIFTAFLTACGCDLNAEVKVNPDETGVRTMVLTLPKSEFNTYGKMKLPDLDHLLAENCPECMTYSYNEDKKNITATFTLPFDSLEDYEQKLDTFCNRQADIHGEISKSPFASNVEYSENLSSKEMMNWLVNLLISEKVVNERYRMAIFDKVSTKLIYGGKEYDCGAGRISISESLYCHIENIDIYTSPSGGNKFTRVIKLYISEEELAKNEAAITSFLTEAIPEGGFGAWEDGEPGMKVFGVSIAECTPEQLQESMKKYTSSDDCSFESAQASSGNGLFYKGCAFREYVDWSNYGCSPEGTVNINYVLEEKISEGKIIDEKNGASYSVSGNADQRYENYMKYAMGDVDETRVYADIAKYYHYSSIDYSVDVKDLDEIKKEIVLHFDNAKAEEIGEVCDRIRQMKNTQNGLDAVECEIAPDVLIMRFTGSAKEINEAFTIISEQTDGSGLSFAKEHKWFFPTEKCVLVDVVDLQGIVYRDPDGSDYWKIPIQYKVDVNGINKEKISEQTEITEKVGSFEGMLSTDKRVKAVYRFNQVNKLAFVWYLLILLGVAAFVFGIINLIRWGIEKRREEREEQAVREVGIGEAVELPDEEPEAEGAIEMQTEGNAETAEAAETAENTVVTEAVDNNTESNAESGTPSESAEIAETAEPEAVSENTETVEPAENAESGTLSESAETTDSAANTESAETSGTDETIDDSADEPLGSYREVSEEIL